MPPITTKEELKLAGLGFFANAATIYGLRLLFLVIKHKDREYLENAEFIANVMGIILLAHAVKEGIEKVSQKNGLLSPSYKSAYANNKKKLTAMIALDVSELAIQFGIGIGLSACFNRDLKNLFSLPLLFAIQNCAEKIAFRTLKIESQKNKFVMSRLIGIIAMATLGAPLLYMLGLESDIEKLFNTVTPIMLGLAIEILLTAKLKSYTERSDSIYDDQYILPASPQPRPNTRSCYQKALTWLPNLNCVNPERTPLQEPRR